MIFEHIVVNLSDYIESYDDLNRERKYILLNDNVDNDRDKIIAQAISLDIRGDYGFFLNRNLLRRETIHDISRVEKYEYEFESEYEHEYEHEYEYEWIGNLFQIIVNEGQGIVRIIDMTDDENSVFIIDIDEWFEALMDWKDFYLNELGFLEYDSMALNHMLGVLMLVYDQMGNNICRFEMFTEAIKKCASRYGVRESVIYRDCRKVVGVYDIEIFYAWAKGILECKGFDSELEKHTNDYIISFIKQNTDISPFMQKHFGIIM